MWFARSLMFSLQMVHTILPILQGDANFLAQLYLCSDYLHVQLWDGAVVPHSLRSQK